MSTKGNDDEKLGDKSDYNPKLDFLSEQFDPLLALNTSGVVVPVPTAKTYDNIGVYKSAHSLPKPQERGKMNKEEAVPGPSTSSGTTVERRWLPHQLPIHTPRKVVNKNLFTKMEEAQGPLALLKNCVKQRLKIKVYNRRAHELRGFCIGYITLFDKHWNMVLEDVYEEWEREVKRKRVYVDDKKTQKFTDRAQPPEIHVKRNARIREEKRRETCSRVVPQLLMRGEHVSHVVVLNDDKKS